MKQRRYVNRAAQRRKQHAGERAALARLEAEVRRKLGPPQGQENAPAVDE